MPLSMRWSRARAMGLATGLSDPATQDMFVNTVPDAMAPGFKYVPDSAGQFSAQLRQATQFTGLKAADGTLLPTPIWGYADRNNGPRTATWPGKTFEVNTVSAGGDPETMVQWTNGLAGNSHLLPVDENLHWCYSLPRYNRFSIQKNGVPIITHLHGGFSDFQFDGNPEFFYNAYEDVIGPQWQDVPGGFTTKFRYDNDVQAGTLWYHDHALGITRLNVYAGLAGFYILRDENDTGRFDNPLNLPAWPYEKAYAIQDRMFKSTGELFYPAYPGDPFYDDFITGEGAVLPAKLFPNGGPTALAEFFGDHMVVNGVIWPKENVEPRNYRFRLLNGTDSRFLGIRFRMASVDDPTAGAGARIPFYVIGSDQGLCSSAVQVEQLIFEPGSRYDIIVDFGPLQNKRVIMENILGDAPFGGNIFPEPDDLFPDRRTDRIMAFDVGPAASFNTGIRDLFDPNAISSYQGNDNTTTKTRRVALFEGTDEFGRLQPLLGVAEPTVDVTGATVEGSIPWHMPTTENPAVGATEEWEIYNATGDAHPIHLHQINFQVLGRRSFSADLVDQPTMQHNGSIGGGFRLENIALGSQVNLGPQDGYVENAPKDMVTALPGQVTTIKTTFRKPGRYVWHCHILSHEDHEMMRVLQVGDPPAGTGRPGGGNGK